jgi:hypothetical protein
MVTLLLGEGVPFFEDTEFARVLLKHGQRNVLLLAKHVFSIRGMAPASASIDAYGRLY